MTGKIKFSIPSLFTRVGGVCTLLFPFLVLNHIRFNSEIETQSSVVALLAALIVSSLKGVLHFRLWGGRENISRPSLKGRKMRVSCECFYWCIVATSCLVEIPKKVLYKVTVQPSWRKKKSFLYIQTDASVESFNKKQREKEERVCHRSGALETWLGVLQEFWSLPAESNRVFPIGEGHTKLASM